MQPKFSPEQQQFVDELIVDVAHKISDFLFQRGIGPVPPVPPPGAPPPGIPPPGMPPGVVRPGVAQPYKVKRRALDGREYEQHKSVPQLLAEMNDKLECLLFMLDEEEAPQKRSRRGRGG